MALSAAAVHLSLHPKLQAKDSCGDCHAVIQQQWRSTLHAYALGPGVIGQFDLFEDDQIKDCLTCHAPMLDTTQHDGDILENSEAVGCKACHGRIDRSHSDPGENTSRSTPGHEICVDCHQFGDEGILVNGKPLENTATEWLQSKYSQIGVTCIDCHMPAGQHQIKGIHDAEMTRSALSISAVIKGNQVIVSVTNRGAGHALPTYITPRIRVLWKQLDGRVLEIASLQRKMTWHETDGWHEIEDTRLMPQQTRTLSFDIADDSKGSIEVWVDPDADYYERVYPAILGAMKELDSSSSSQSMIRDAMSKAGQSSYRLYSLNCNHDEGVCQ